MERIRHRRDFIAAAKAKSAPQGGILAQVRDRGDVSPARLGLTCTKRLGNAVVRNRIKRRIREAARLALVDVARVGHDYVLVGRTSALNRNFELLKKDIISALAKLHSELAKDKTQGPS